MYYLEVDTEHCIIVRCDVSAWQAEWSVQ